MIVDTATLAATVGLSRRQIQRLAKQGIITPVDLRAGLTGRPTMWFDLDASVAQLDSRQPMSLTDH
jgi:hypothetical protein